MQPQQQPRWMGWGAGIGLVWALGCGGLFPNKVEECNALVDVINPAAAEFDRLSAVHTSDPAAAVSALQALASLARQVVRQIDSLALSDEDLAAQAHQYSEMCRQIAASADETTQVLQTATALEERIQAQSSTLQTTLQRVASTCSGSHDASACVQVVRRLPDDLGDPGALDAYLIELRALDLREPAVQTSLTHFIAALEDLQDTLQEALALHRQAEALQSNMARVAEQEDAIISALNGFCQG